MDDCTNVEIRELLPERASGALSAADLARVDAHLASCGLCTNELALIQSARGALRHEPRVDVARIAAAVRSVTAAPARPVLVGGARTPRQVRPRWVGWKTAAAVAILAAGGGTMLFWSGAETPTTPGPVQTTGVTPPVTAPSTSVSASVPAAPASLNVAGGLSDLSESDLRSLLDDIGSLGVDAAAFEEPGAVLPDLPATEGLES
ncbi:MAG TPA: zf-HC2 domain-containing protein [Gemmatimonadaceae bacterium]|nr:zf-HC2 domain-containing protein [Gemmatimonadaceae bacterium]